MNTLVHERTEIDGRKALELAELKQHIRTLITLEATDAPVISCYLNLEAVGREDGVVGGQDVFRERRALLRKSMVGERKQYFEEALQGIEEYLENRVQPESNGVAIFARGGARPFFLPLQFQVPLLNWIVVGPTPNVYHLVELKDTYHRFVLLLLTEKGARILQVNLGAVTGEVWAERPELRDRVSSGWSKTHYQHHREQQTVRFIAEEIRVLDRLMSSGGHSHLILAGNPGLTERMRQALPKHLAAKLVDTVHASARDAMPDIVAATNSLFVEQEEAESLAKVCLLEQEINTHGLAVAGTKASLRAVNWGQADVLIMAKAYAPEPGWLCGHCGNIAVVSQRPPACPECMEFQLQEIDLKEELVRLAERNGVEVEIVDHSDLLMELGGVACLLRYQRRNVSRLKRTN